MLNEKKLGLVCVVVALIAGFTVVGLHARYVAIEPTIEPEEPKSSVKVSFAISGSELFVTVSGEERFKVCRIYNRGNVVLNVSACWVGDELSVMVEPSSVVLEAEETSLIYLTVFPSGAGVFDGAIEFLTFWSVAGEVGMKTSPGGTVKVHVTVES